MRPLLELISVGFATSVFDNYVHVRPIKVRILSLTPYLKERDGERFFLVILRVDLRREIFVYQFCVWVKRLLMSYLGALNGLWWAVLCGSCKVI